jgi:hypothetical protein
MTGSSGSIGTAGLAKLLAMEARRVLLLFWAPWHIRSRELLAEAEKLTQTHGDEIVLVSINIEREVDLAMRYGMRAVPLMILLDHGEEVARSGGTVEVSAWLWRQGLCLSAMPAGFELPRQALQGGAFHGDAKLRTSLIECLHERAQQSAIVVARVPFWHEDRGTISGTLGKSTRPDILEARTGLPFSFLCALEFLAQEWSEGAIDAVFGEILPGADLSLIALRLVQGTFADPEVDWAAIIDDTQLDRLRTQWVRLVDRHVCGLAVSRAEWDALLVDLGLLRSEGRAPARSVQDAVIDMIGTLSPPPAHDDDLWVSALSMHGIYLLHVIVQHDLGWTRSDFAFEGERGQWFLARERQQPGGRFSEQALLVAQREWIAQRGEAQHRYDEILQESSAHFPLLSHRLRQRLIALLRETALRACA